MSNKLSGAFSLDLEKAAEKHPELLDEMAVELFGEGATWATHKEQVLEYQRQLVKSMQGLNRFEVVFAKRREKIEKLNADSPDVGMRAAAQTIAIMKRINPEWSEKEVFDTLLGSYLNGLEEYGVSAGGLGDIYDICDTIRDIGDHDNAVEVVFTKYVEGKA